MIESSIFQIVLFFGLWVVAWTPLAFFLAYTLGWNPLKSLSPLQKLPFVLSLYFLAPFLLGVVLLWADLRWRSIGISVANLLSGSFVMGLIISACSIVGLFTVFLILGWVKNSNNRALESTQDSSDFFPEKPPDDRSSVLSPIVLIPAFLGLGIIVGGIEELVFRGFLTGRLCEVASIGVAGAIASLIFATLHLVWEGKENIPQLPGLWVMGMVLTVAWWIDGQAIALAWGLHAGWVWSIATIDTLELVEYTHAVPSWVTGIDNKPLAGVMGVGALALTGLGLCLLYVFL